jgi:hypothetical protein
MPAGIAITMQPRLLSEVLKTGCECDLAGGQRGRHAGRRIPARCAGRIRRWLLNGYHDVSLKKFLVAAVRRKFDEGEL